MEEKFREINFKKIVSRAAIILVVVIIISGGIGTVGAGEVRLGVAMQGKVLNKRRNYGI